MDFNIIFEDEHIIVCYKPAGIPTQTSRLGEQDMVSLLKNYLYKNQQEKKETYVAVIHRLDQPVEGLLVFAKDSSAAKELNKDLQGVGFGKYYKAVLWGVPKEKTATLEDYLVKDARTNTSRVASVDEKDAKKAVLSYEVLATSQEDEKEVGQESENESRQDGRKAISLVKIKLNTGRHHQIRVQMANMGCPIWGDSKYNTKSVQDRRFRQIALCAYRLEFVHPKTKKRMEFEINPEGEGFRNFKKA